jgi:hypothetical protein
MRKTALFSALLIAAGASLLAAPKGKTQLGQMQGQQNQNNNMDQMADCTKLTADEQNFANQLMDMNNRNMFCTQFTPQQRRQAMQMMGQQDASGNMMNADQSVQQVMQSGGMSPMNQQRNRSSGGCPVK